MANVKCVIKNDFGIVGSHNASDVYLRLIEWNNAPAKYDLRGWTSSNVAGHGIVFDRNELAELGKLIDSYLAENDDEVEEENEAVTVPKKRGRKPKNIAQTVETQSAKVAHEEKKEVQNVVQFPGNKPNIISLPTTDGKATVRECREKFEKEREIYKDGDSQYVIEKLLELCDRSQDFRNNVMRKDKSYAGAFAYMTEQVRKGYCMKVNNNVCYLDNELAFALFVDYYNMDEAAMDEAKKHEKEEKKNAEPVKKRGRKKKGE